MTRTILKNTKISPNACHLVLKYSLMDPSYYHLKKLEGHISSHGHVTSALGILTSVRLFRRGKLSSTFFSTLCSYSFLNLEEIAISVSV